MAPNGTPALHDKVSAVDVELHFGRDEVEVDAADGRACLGVLSVDVVVWAVADLHIFEEGILADCVEYGFCALGGLFGEGFEGLVHVG